MKMNEKYYLKEKQNFGTKYTILWESPLKQNIQKEEI